MEETEKQESDSNPFEHDAEQIGQTEQSEDVENGVASEGEDKSASSKEVLDEFLKQHKSGYKKEKNVLEEQRKEEVKENPKGEMVQE